MKRRVMALSVFMAIAVGGFLSMKVRKLELKDLLPCSLCLLGVQRGLNTNA
jgi:hypothetical protein